MSKIFMEKSGADGTIAPNREPLDITELVKGTKHNLQELAKKTESPQANGNINEELIDEIIQALNILNNDRVWLHEALEAETIKSSVHRHKLARFPKNIEKEIEEAVKSARKSNCSNINAYEKRLAKTVKNIENLKVYNKQLKIDNIALGPLAKGMRENYDGVVTSLNKTLDTKARMQIKVNETQDLLKETFRKTREYESACVDLREDMVMDQEEAVIDAEELNQEIVKSLTEVQKQEDANSERMSEIDQLNVVKTEYEAAIIQKEKDLEVLNNNYANLALIKDHRIEQIAKETETNQNLTKKGVEIFVTHEKMKAKFVEEEKELQTEIENLNVQLDVAKKEFDELQTTKIHTFSVFEREMISGRNDKDIAEEMRRRLRIAKDDLHHQTNECMRLKRESIEIEVQIQRTMQEHLGACAAFQKHIHTLQKTLVSEAKEKSTLLKEKEDLSRETSDYVSAFNKIILKTFKAIEDGKLHHKKQIEKGLMLKEEFQKMAEIIKGKQSILLTAKSCYLKMSEELKGKLNMLKETISNFEKELSAKESHLQEVTLSFEELQRIFTVSADDFDVLKKLIVEKKNIKSSLEATLSSKKSKLNDLTLLAEKVTQDIVKGRVRYVEQLEVGSKESEYTEKEIYETTQKVNMLSQQNEKLSEAIDGFQLNISSMDACMQEMKRGRVNINNNVIEHNGWLEMQWRKHKQFNQMHNSEDVLMLDSIKNVEQNASTRKNSTKIFVRLYIISCIRRSRSSMGN